MPRNRSAGRGRNTVSSLSDRAGRRARGERHGEISRIVHGPHDTAWLYSGTLYASGQDRINHKRNQRAQFWRDFEARAAGGGV